MVTINLTDDEYEKLCWLLEELDADTYTSEDEVATDALDKVRNAEEG